MALMQPCSADLPFKVCGFARWVVLPGRFKAAESKSDSALHGSRSANRKKREQNSRFAGHNGLSEARAVSWISQVIPVLVATITAQFAVVVGSW
jgi:hypothetical protein